MRSALALAFVLLVAACAAPWPVTRTPSSGPKPDLTIQSFSVRYGAACAWGSPGQVGVPVTNAGEGDAGPFSVTINGGTVRIDGLAAGQSVQAMVDFADGPVGHVEALADSEQQVDEADEGNNAFRISMTPPAPCPLELNPSGGPIAVGTPLPPAPASPGAITPENAAQLREAMQLGEPGDLGLSAVAFSRDGAVLVELCGDLRLWAMPDGRLLRTVRLDSRHYMILALSPDGGVAAIGNYPESGWIELWNLSTGERMREHRRGEQVRALGFGAAGALLAAGRADGTVHVWDVASGELRAELGRVLGAFGMDWNPDGTTMAAAGSQGTLRVWDPLRDEVLDEWPLPGEPRYVDISEVHFRPDGRMVAASMFVDKRVALWEQGVHVYDLEHGGTVWKTTWSPDGRLLAVVENGGPTGEQVLLWDVRARRAVLTLPGLGGDVAFSPDGSRLVAQLQESGRLSIWALP